MLLDPSADVFSFVCLFIFIFVVPLPSSPAEVRGQGQFRSSSSRPEIRRVAQILSLRSADVLAKQAGCSRRRRAGRKNFFCCFSCRETFFFFFFQLLLFLFFFHDWLAWQEVRREPEEELCLPRSCGDGHDLLSRPLICNRNLFVFWPPFYRPPHSAVPLVSLLNFAQQSWIKKRETDIWVYIYILKNI